MVESAKNRKLSSRAGKVLGREATCSCDRRTGASRDATGIKARPKGRCVLLSTRRARVNNSFQQPRGRGAVGAGVVWCSERRATRARDAALVDRHDGRTQQRWAGGLSCQCGVITAAASSTQCGAVVEWAAVVSPRWVCIVLAPSCVLATKKLTFGYDKHHACGGIRARSGSGRDAAEVCGCSGDWVIVMPRSGV